MEAHQALLDIATRETGLNDFGIVTFREGLERLVNALNNEARLNAIGEKFIRERILNHLKQRLQIEDWYRRHPEIDAEIIKAPLIGISLPRTGSTALSFLLAEDPHARSLRRLEAAQPCPPPGAAKDANTKIDHDATMRRESGLKTHTPSGENAPAECQDLMALDFKSQIFPAFAQVPSYMDWLMDADLTSTYLYERRALKLLQWRMPNKPWRLKCPTHLIYLEHLNHAFPDARFVMTHRDPTDVMLSVIDVYADIVSKFTDHLDIRYQAELNIHQWSIGMQRALTFRDAGNDHRFYDIHFRAMHEDPIGQVRGLYQWLGEPVTPEFEAGMARWWKENSENREPSSKKDAAAYGVDLDQVRGLFAEYTKRMSVWTNTNV
ncbi:MAG: sulfotransferase [Spongiibacteraceae bacterium]